MKKLLFGVLALSLVSMPITQAAPAIHGIFASVAEGRQGQPLPIVKVWPGVSVDIDLIDTGELIRKAWIDDPSRIAVDFDSCLGSSGGNQSGQSGDCGARVVHLRQIHTPRIPGLTYAPSTFLTLITESPKGKWKRYKFQIVPVGGNTAPEYYAVTITPDSYGTAYLDVGAAQKATIDDVVKGLGIARSQGMLPSKSPLISKIDAFVSAVRGGSTLEEASQTSGVSLALVNRLAGMAVPPLATAPTEAAPQLPTVPPAPQSNPSESPLPLSAPQPLSNSNSDPLSDLKVGQPSASALQVPASTVAVLSVPEATPRLIAAPVPLTVGK
jgi:hypothetical protein